MMIGSRPQASLVQRTGLALAEALRHDCARAAAGQRPDPPRERSADRRHRRPAAARLDRPHAAAHRPFGDRARDQQLPALAAAPDQLPLAGWVGFDAVQFEVRCPTGLRGTPPHLDLLALREGAAVAVTVRCTEYLSRRKSAVAPSYDRLLAATPALEPWHRLLQQLRAEPSAYRHVDLGGLVKYALALGRTFPDRLDHAALPVLGAAGRRSVRRVPPPSRRARRASPMPCAGARVRFQARASRLCGGTGASGARRTGWAATSAACAAATACRSPPSIGRRRSAIPLGEGRSMSPTDGIHYDPLETRDRRAARCRAAGGAAGPAAPRDRARAGLRGASRRHRSRRRREPRGARRAAGAAQGGAPIDLPARAAAVRRAQRDAARAARQGLRLAGADLRARGHAARLLALCPRAVRRRLPRRRPGPQRLLLPPDARRAR